MMNPLILNVCVSKQNYFQVTLSILTGKQYSYWKTFRNVVHFQQLKIKENPLFFNEVF